VVDVDTSSFLVIVAAATASGALAMALASRIAISVVVIELAVGILIGPQVLGFASVSQFSDFFSSLGLGMLFFFAGYEIDFCRIAGRPLRLAAAGWALSLALAYTIGGLLAAAGIVVSLIYTGSAMATTAIGTLIPILRDGGELRTRFGTYLLGIGALGEFGPILLITLTLSANQPLHETAILIAFIALAVGVAIAAVRGAFKG
jgi:Kef-type K+ transport system membrane component KefB